MLLDNLAHSQGVRTEAAAPSPQERRQGRHSVPRASHPLPGGLRREGSRAQKTPSALRQTRRPVPHGSATAIAARPARRRPPTAAAIATATAGNGRRARPLEPRPARSDWLFPPNYESLNAPREGRRDYSSQSALRRLRRGRCKMAAGGEEGRAAEPEPAAEPEVAAEEPRSFKDLVSPGWSRFCPCCSLRRPAYPAGGSSSHSPVWQAVQAAGGPRPGGAAGSRGGWQTHGPPRSVGVVPCLGRRSGEFRPLLR